jgi:hypothetical protein
VISLAGAAQRRVLGLHLPFLECISIPVDTDRRRVVRAGGSGFLGLSIAAHLANSGWSRMVLSRRPPSRGGPWLRVGWAARTLEDWYRTLNGESGPVNRFQTANQLKEEIARFQARAGSSTACR